MAAPVKSLQPLKSAPGPSPVTAEQKYWRTFKHAQLIPTPNAIAVTHVSYPSNPTTAAATTASDQFAVTSGNRVQIYSARSRKVVKTISRFGLSDTAHSGEIRNDGRVVCAGGDSGAVQVFDIGSRAILKTWKEHKQPVWTTKWNPTNLTSLMSTSDDRSVRIWDLPSQESVTKFVGHQDYVRCGTWMPGQSSGLVTTGSYDQTVRIWDPRGPSDKAVMTFKHAAAIEDVLALPVGTTLLTASGNSITVLDLVAARPLTTLRSHQKTVTSLALNSNGTRFLSGGLDGHVKIFSTSSWAVVAGSKYPAPVLSVNVIPAPISSSSSSSSVSPSTDREDRHLAVGLQSGLLSLRTRLSGPQKALARAREKEMSALVAGTIESHDRKVTSAKKQKHLTQGRRARLRGLDYDGHANADIVIEGNPRDGKGRTKLQPWDAALRSLEYSKALDLALAHRPSDPNMVLTVLTALVHRSALRTALKDRDEEALMPILSWISKHVCDARHVVLIARTGMLVLELYAGKMGCSERVDRGVRGLHERVREGVDVAQSAWCTVGMLEGVFGAGAREGGGGVG